MTEIITDLYSFYLQRPSVLTIGSFDGVHRGHQHLLNTAIAHARAALRDAVSVVVTLHPHPKIVLHPAAPLQLLSTLDERLELLKQLGLDYVVAFPFSPEVAQIRARDFVKLLRDHLRMIELVCGPNFALGYKREGTLAFLRELGEAWGFDVTVVAPRAFEGGMISSTRVRTLIAEGDVATAARLLTHYPVVHGTVVPGDHRGRALGYPTANLHLPDRKLIPANGIYAVRVRLGDEWFDGAASIGIRPTFGGGRRLVEVHIMDFDRDIYGREIEVHFVERLRDELKFDRVEALVQQIGEDVTRARALLAQIPIPAPRAVGKSTA